MSGEYEEVILIAFSEILEIRSKYFDSYHKPWTWHLLSKESFPFSKVIFVCKQHGDSALVFDKNIQSPQPPERDYEKELGVTRISGPILPLEEEVKLYEMFDNKPLIRPPQKSKLKNKKRKAQKNARKINRKN
ncbi:hypothetical protein [Salinicola salarius]|uniref:hypothetical protein n=1 Tax=Salinicola salarius TaxID=430457 RepID=UPI00117AEFEE|nr:hypothetical protein [Salinicola salarius]